MDLLIDTHVLAWFSAGDERTSRIFRNSLEDTSVRLFVSAITAFEYSDLLVQGRFPESVPLGSVREELGFELLDYQAGLFAIAADLPEIHRDPIDRMLIAQAIALDLTLVTADKSMQEYPVKWLW